MVSAHGRPTPEQRGDVMIELEIDGDGYALDDRTRDDIELKIGGLDAHMESLQHGHVTVSWEGGPNEQTKVSAHIWGSGHRFDASDVDRNALIAVDNACNKLATQIRREHRKEVAKRRHG
jgi:ribosomal subunit interface protein